MILTALALVIVTPILAAPIVLISLFTSSGGVPFKIARLWSIIVRKCMGLTFSVTGREKIVPGASYLVTPNHQGNADILALYGVLGLPFRWVIKKELLKIPVFGQALAGTGAIALDRSNREKAIESLKSAKDKLAGGWSVLIYPEGTRSSDPYLQPFKKGAFMLAVQTGIPILPVTCNGAFHILPKKTIVIIPGHIAVVIGDPIPTEGLTEADVPELMEKTRKEILKNLDVNFDPFDSMRSQDATRLRG
jgi:1-acyl-sn-glycerol-3-phosphate acyltransferase